MVKKVNDALCKPKKKKKEEKGLELCDSTLYPQNIVYQV